MDRPTGPAFRLRPVNGRATPRLRTSGIRRRLGGIAIAYLAVTLIGALVCTYAIVSWTQSLDDRRSALVAQTELEALRAGYSDQETGLRGFLISGTEDFLTPYRNGLSSVKLRSSAIRRLIDSRAVHARVRAVTEAGDLWRRVIAEPNIELRRAGPVPPESLRTGKPQFDTVRSRLASLGSEISRRVSSTTAASNRARSAAIAALVVSLVGAIAVTLVASTLIRRWLIWPLDHLTRAASGAASVGPLAEVPREGPEELQQVGDAIDAMQRQLSSQRDDAIRARESLEQSAAVAIRLREELAHELGDFPAGWTVAADLLPAEGVVAGDSYDVSLIGPRLIGVILIDIAGHGAGPGIMALRCKELLKAAVRSGLEPGAALEWLFGQDHGLVDGNFFTAFVAVIDTDSGDCRYANAGHPPPVLTGPQRYELNPTGPLFGPLPGSQWATRAILIGSGQQLIAYTDGLTEARDADRGFYGPGRLVDAIERSGGDEADNTIKSILDDLRLFTDGRWRDDVTVVAVCRS